MTPTWHAHRPLVQALSGNGLFSAWLAGDLPAAPESWQTLLNQEGCSSADETAPFFADDQASGFGSQWYQELAADMPSSADGQLLQKNLAQLRSGNAQVLVTGQQPGALGGPLYTLFKIATTVAAADRLTQAGQPTVPVFWSGDDDDDLVEAMAPQGWDASSGRLFRNDAGVSAFAGRQAGRPCVGELSAARWSQESNRWLDAWKRSESDGPGDPTLGTDLAAIWSTACADNWSWSRLNRRFLLRVFQGTGLLIVSGDDPRLHQAGEAFYQQVISLLPDLMAAATGRGQELIQAGFPLPVSERSVHRHLFVRENSERYVLENITPTVDPARLRPGVLLRSLLQDWLFRPAAVVVGPGELAYLHQLVPLYKILGIPRSPLLPRLFGTIMPKGMSPEILSTSDQSHPEMDPELLVEKATRVSENVVREILEKELGVPDERAEKMAKGRSRRWRKSLQAMFRGELENQARQVPQRQPAWVFPSPGRQERTLSFLTSAAQWGHPLITAVLDSAADHLEQGNQNNWQDYVIQVDDPAKSQIQSE